MRIYDQNLTGTPAAESGRAQETQATGRTESQRTGSVAQGSGDQVELSSTLQSLSRAVSTYGANRGAKVQALTAQYRNGAYQTDPGAISRSLVTEALDGGQD